MNQLPLLERQAARTKVRRYVNKQGLFFFLCLILLSLDIIEETTAIRVLPSSRGTSSSFDSTIAHRGLGEEVKKDAIRNGNDNNDAANVQNHRKVEVNVAENPDEHLVESLPLLEGQLTTPHWAGLLPASADGDKYFFYWLFAPEGASDMQDTSIPLIIWLNGGPGCSSMDGLFIENGPFRFVLENPSDSGNSNWKLTLNEYSWHKIPAFVVYIDQPVGTGLSFTTSNKYPTNDEEVNIDFYYFLKEFLNLHADKFLIQDTAIDDESQHVRMPKRPIYFTGESHSGHYIPSMMAYILKQNDRVKGGDDTSQHKMYIELSGAAIGNGWMDPIHQYAAGTAAYGHGIIGRSQLAALNERELECQNLLKQGKYVNTVCFELLDNVVHQSLGDGSRHKVSQYDVRKIEESRGSRAFPVGHKVVEAYLAGSPTGSDGGKVDQSIFPTVLEAIHATASHDAGQKYQECTDPPYNALAHQDGKGVVEDVVYLLDHATQKVRLLFFNGMEDLICNHVGNEIFLETMKWKHQKEYVQSHRFAWKAPSERTTGKINGYMKQYDNHLLFLKLLDSGHMVPMDIPEIALSMMQIFIKDKDSKGTTSFSMNEQRLDTSIPKREADCPVCQIETKKSEKSNPPKSEQKKCEDSTNNNNNSNITGGVASSSAAAAMVSSVAGTKIIAYTWVGAIVVSAVIVLALCYNRRRVFTSQLYPTATQYDLELRDTGGSYRDTEIISASDVETDDHMGDHSSDGDSSLENNRHRHFPPSNGYKK